MRLHPQVSVEEAYAWLRRQVLASEDIRDTRELEQVLRPLAEAMAAVSAVPLSETIEPLAL
jgi:hypothetical protein